MISIGDIIYRIQEHPLLKNVRKSDIVNHVKYVIELVGAPALLEDKMVELIIKDYRVKLPEDFHSRVTVRANIDGNRIVLTHNTDDFRKFNSKVNEDIEDDTIENYSDTLFTHYIVDGFLYTDFINGTVELVYKAFKQDENGWPVLPDNVSLVLAIENYIKSRHFGILADLNANYERAYQRAEQQYTWYIAQATASILNPDPVEAKALGDRIIRLLPLTDSFYTNEKYASQPERLNKSVW